MSATVSIHLHDDKIVWRNSEDTFWVQIGDEVSIFVPDQPTAVRLTGLLQVARQRNAAKLAKLATKIAEWKEDQ